MVDSEEIVKGGFGGFGAFAAEYRERWAARTADREKEGEPVAPITQPPADQIATGTAPDA